MGLSGIVGTENEKWEDGKENNCQSYGIETFYYLAFPSNMRGPAGEI